MVLKSLGRYEIVRAVGKGAMGMVYEARDPNLDRRVAIKTIKVENLSQEAAAEYETRFRTEARSAARLQHPHIVSVYDSGRHGDIAYLVMEFVQGDDLKQLLGGGRTFTLAESTQLMRELLSALDYAHQQNIVHRDVKPANLLVEPGGRVKLTDFGVARIQDAADATRTRGSMVGTLKYMAPEQVQGLPVDAGADIFAAGVVLYQLLTGRRPFDGENDFAIIQQIIGEMPAAPSTINPLLPSSVDAVLAKALAKARAERFASAQAFAAALQEAVGMAPDQTIAPPPPAARRAGSGGGGQPSRADVSGSTVTQELELVYWKDVRDSDDADDVQGFLDRFPKGIYADLARRRLRRLGVPVAAEQTLTALQTRVMDRLEVESGFAATQQMHDETLLLDREGTATLPSGGDAQQTDATVQQTRSAQEPTVALPADGHSDGLPATVATAASQGSERPGAGAAPDTLLARRQQGASAAARGRKDRGSGPSGARQPAHSWRAGKPLALASGFALVVALAAWSLWPASSALQAVRADPGAGMAQPLMPDLAASADAMAGSGPESGSASGATAPVAAAHIAAVASGAAGVPPALLRPPSPAPLVTNAASTSAAPDVGKAATATPAKAASPAPRPVVNTARNESGATDPSKACEGRLLLSYQTCMADQCAKPALVAHPICKQRRMAEEARAAQQSSRN